MPGVTVPNRGPTTTDWLHGEILKVARECATEILEEDANLQLPKNQMISEQVSNLRANESNWARIS